MFRGREHVLLARVKTIDVSWNKSQTWAQNMARYLNNQVAVGLSSNIPLTFENWLVLSWLYGRHVSIMGQAVMCRCRFKTQDVGELDGIAESN